MISIVLIILSFVFLYMLYSAYKNESIMAKGWFFEIRYYNRYESPFMFWLHVILYSIIAVWALAFGAMSLISRF